MNSDKFFEKGRNIPSKDFVHYEGISLLPLHRKGFVIEFIAGHGRLARRPAHFFRRLACAEYDQTENTYAKHLRKIKKWMQLFLKFAACFKGEIEQVLRLFHDYFGEARAIGWLNEDSDKGRVLSDRIE